MRYGGIGLAWEPSNESQGITCGQWEDVTKASWRADAEEGDHSFLRFLGCLQFVVG